jgi:glycosyltransferase involved in cell wall biosynthesis
VDLDVLLPFHREDEYLDEAINSLARSKGVNFRVILIDDRPNNKTFNLTKFKVLKNYEILRTQGSQGYGEALRLGTAALEADAVALFNSDDLVHPERFIKQMACLNKSEISVSRIVRINSRGHKSKSILGEMKSFSYDEKFLLLGAYGANASWCMRKEWWNDNAFFDSSECLDWRIALRGFKNTSISYVSDPLYFYRKHSNQVTANRNIDKNRFDVVFNVWAEFAQNVGLVGSTREIFEIMAVPWLGAYKTKFEIQSNWATQLMSLFSSQKSELRVDVTRLLRRRMLLASFNSRNSSRDRVNFLRKGIKELYPLISDLFV